MSVRIQSEAFSRWMREAVQLGLLEAHWNEVGEHRDTIALEPDFEKLLGLERAGVMACATARAEVGSALLGYAAMLVSPHLLYKSHLLAYSISVYMTPEHRGHGPELVRAIERDMRGRGATKVFFIAKERTAFADVLEGMGYEPSETAFGKLLV